MFFFKVTEDISLRLLEERHAEALFTLIEHNRAFLEKWQPYLGDIKTVEAARGLIKSGLQIMLKNESFFAGIWFNAELAGFLALEDLNLRARNAKIGYWLGERFQGKGLVTNSCQALIDYAFNELQLNRLEIDVAVDNIRSRAIPERLGFTQEGLLRGKYWVHDHFVDAAVYGLLASDWESSSKEQQ